MGARVRIGRVWKVALLLAVGAAGGAAAVAVASVPDSNGVIHACYEVPAAGSTVPSTTGPNLRIIDPSAGQTCRSGSPGAVGAEQTIAWNQVGRQGPQGPAGPAGAAGAAGNVVTVLGGNTLTIGGSVVTVGAPSGVTINAPALGPNAKPIGTGTAGGLGSFNVLSVGLGGGGATARAAVHELVVTKYVDKASPKLQLACANGKHIPKVIIELRKGGGGKEFLQYTLKDVLVSSYQVSGHSNSTKPVETVSFNYSTIAYSYSKQD